MHQEDFEVVAGDDLPLDLTLLDANEEPVTDLVGATGEMQIRRTIKDPTLILTTAAVITPATATVQFTLSDVETKALLGTTCGKEVYVYGCKITYSDGNIFTLMTGRLTVINGVVRA